MKKLPLLLVFLLPVVVSARHRDYSFSQPRNTQKIVYDQDIPKAKINPTIYSGKLKYNGNSFFSFLWRPKYDYSLTGTNGETTAFLDITNLSTPLLNLEGKTITVNGQAFPHKYRGVMVIVAQSILPAENE